MDKRLEEISKDIPLIEHEWVLERLVKMKYGDPRLYRKVPEYARRAVERYERETQHSHSKPRKGPRGKEEERLPS